LSARVDEIVSKFQSCADAKQRYQLVLQYAEQLPAFPEDLKENGNRVLGCTAQVLAPLGTRTTPLHVVGRESSKN
jgi:cysteine desulfuration protein SufE